jgi:hypothetical protein
MYAQHSMGILPPISHHGAPAAGGAPGSPLNGGNMFPLGGGRAGGYLREEASAPPASFGYNNKDSNSHGGYYNNNTGGYNSNHESGGYNAGGAYPGEPLSPLSPPSAMPLAMAGLPPGSKLAHPPNASVVMHHPPPQYAGIGPRVVTHHAKGMRDLQLELAVLKVCVRGLAGLREGEEGGQGGGGESHLH